MEDNGAAARAGIGVPDVPDLRLLADVAADSVVVTVVSDVRPRPRQDDLGESRAAQTAGRGAVPGVPAAGRGTTAGRGGAPGPPVAGRGGAPGVGEKRPRPCGTDDEHLQQDRAACVAKMLRCTQCNQDPKPLSVADTIKFLLQHRGCNSTLSDADVQNAVFGRLIDADKRRQGQPVIIAECGCVRENFQGACYTASLLRGVPRVAANGKPYGNKVNSARHILNAIKAFIKHRDQDLAERAALHAPSPAAAAQLTGAPGAAGAPPARGQQPPPPPPDPPLKQDAYPQIVALRKKMKLWPWEAAMIFYLQDEEIDEWSKHGRGESKAFQASRNFIQVLRTRNPGPSHEATCHQWMKSLVNETLQLMPPHLARRNTIGDFYTRDRGTLYKYVIDKYLAADALVEQPKWKAALDSYYPNEGQFFEMMGVLFESFIPFHTAGSSGVGGAAAGVAAAGAAAGDNAGGAAAGGAAGAGGAA